MEKRFGIKVLGLITVAAIVLGVISLPFTAPAESAADQTINGTLYYSDESVYEGDILNERIRNGTGSFTWSTGEIYSGEWENDIINGEGTLTWPGLGVYEGDFVNGKREGRGTFTWTYEGEPEDGYPVSYEGEWTEDQIGPTGTLILAGIGTYTGEFSRQMRNGEGTFTWTNGDIYSGKWSNDLIHGEGTLITADNTILDGTFYQGYLANGTITYPVNGGSAVRNVNNARVLEGATITYQDGTIVKGNIRNKEFYGNVTITYANGDIYVGTLKDGLKDGKGIYTWRSGAHYSGAWSEDKMNGEGIYYYSSNERILYLSGTFQAGSPAGTLTYVGDNGLKYKTTWKNGSCINIQYQGR